MVFSSLFFVFCFFPLNMLLYWLMPDLKRKNIVMLIFSLIFYAWGGPLYIFLLVGMTLADYIAAILIEDSQTDGQRKAMLAVGCGVNLTLLVIFKYLTFILTNIHNLCGVPEEVLQIALPIGISFYTFQLLSYMVDVYRGEVYAQRNFATLLLYVSLFHQCIAGPIIRYETVAAELSDRRVKVTDLYQGTRRFAIGLAKKALLANYCGTLANTFLCATDNAAGADVLLQKSALSILIGSICYTMQIYLDFSAYSDMAIGMGRMIGFHYLENFDYPYMSASITEFWRRWHISLSTFFRDYVYIPLGGNRCSKARHIFNLLVVWTLTGFWHGASWNYMFWGLFNFAFLMLEKFLLADRMDDIPSPIMHIYALLVINFGWILFRCENLSWLGIELKGLLGLNGNGFCNYETLVNLKSNMFFLVVAMIACTPLAKNIRLLIQKLAYRNNIAANVHQVIQALIPVVLLILSTASLVGDSYNPFLYLRF